MNITILLTGANGQVGWEVERRGRAAGHTVIACDRTDLDITDAAAIARIIDASGAQVVINTAAYTAVDNAEREPERAFAVNRDGVRYLAQACADRAIPLLHLSTDYVFDGRKQTPYAESDPVAPLGVYGLSKWQGEQVLRETWPWHVILRTSWVFGSHGHNFVKTILRLARERDELKVVADQIGCPTFAGALAEMLLALAERCVAEGSAAFSLDSVWGTYHGCGQPATSWYGFAQAILAAARGYEPLRARAVIPITTAQYPTPAARPPYSVLNCARLQARCGLTPPAWAEGLEYVVRTLMPTTDKRC